MLVDDGLKLHGTSKIVVKNVTTLPLVAIDDSVVYLTQQDSTYAPGLYLRSAGVWVVFNGADIEDGWWDTNAVLVIDGTLGTLGANDVTSPIPGVTLVPGTYVTHSDEQVRSGNKSLLFSNSSSNYNGILTIIRDGATTPLLEELDDFTIECVTKKRYNVASNNRFVFYLNQTQNAPIYTDRIVLGANFTNTTYLLKAWFKTQNPVTMINTGLTPSNLNWIHEAITYSNTTKLWSYYVDGLLKGTYTKTLPPTTLQDEYLGAWGGAIFLDRYQIIPGIKYTSNFTPAI